MVSDVDPRRLVVVSVVTLVALSSFCDASILDSMIINVDIEREIDLTSQVGTYVVDMKLENVGSSDATEFHLALPASMAKNLAYMEVRIRMRNQSDIRY